MKIIENCRIKHLLKRCNEFFSLYLLKLYSILIIVIDTDLSSYKFTNISCIELFVLISSTIVSSPRLFLNFLLFILERARFVSPTFLLSWIIWTLFSTIFPSSDTIFPLAFESLDSCFPLLALLLLTPYLYLSISAPVSRPCNFFLKEREQGISTLAAAFSFWQSRFSNIPPPDNETFEPSAVY